jgi:hypothetical protein
VTVVCEYSQAKLKMSRRMIEYKDLEVCFLVCWRCYRKRVTPDKMRATLKRYLGIIV